MAGSFAFPWLTRYIIDDVLVARRSDLLLTAMLGLLAAFFSRDAFNSLRIRINNTFEQNVIYDMRREVYARLQRLPVGYFDQRSSGDLMTRVIEDVNSVERVLIDGTEQGTIAILSIVGVLVILFSMNPLLAATALLPIPILAAGALWYTMTAHKRYRRQREASSGHILLDGHDTSKIPLTELRGQISVVSQEAFLFNGTVRENILYGRLDASEADMIAAAQAANCHEFISRLPEGYDSKVGERGVKLSVGEKQRVSIARALLKDAPILVLDEATASVDTATERLIQEALERLMRGRTSFVIAHRLSTIRRADQILVVKGGEIVERGTHEELLSTDGLYARLARIQNTTFIEESFEKLTPV